MLVLTAVFHFLRGAPVDAWIFLGGAVLIALDALGWLHIPVRALPDGQTLSRRVIAFSLIGVAALTFAFAPLYGGADTALVVGLGVLLLPVVWADRPRASGAADAGGRPQSQDAAPEARAAIRRAAIAWSAVIVAGCAWEIAAFFLGRSSPAAENAFPALSDLVDPAVAWPPARAALVVLWLAGGYALLRRGRR